MTQFDPKQTDNYSRKYGTAAKNKKQSRLPVGATFHFRSPEPKQNHGPQPEQIGAGPSPKSQLDLLIGLGVIEPTPQR